MKSFRGVLFVALMLGAAPAFSQGQPPAAKPADAAPAWKPFQEMAFLVGGSFSGTAEQGPRIGGRVGRFSLEMGGNYLLHRGNVIFTAQQQMPEESIEEVGYYVYDREKRKYTATYFFSTGVVGIYDVDFPSPGTVRLVSRELLNYEAGGRSRLVIARKSDTEISHQSDLAPAGKEFVPYIVSKLTKK